MNIQAVDSERSFDFGSIHTDNVPGLLQALNLTLAVTSYQADRLFFLRSDGKELDTHFCEFPRPMGIAAREGRLTLGTLSRVLDFRRSDDLLGQLQQGLWEDQQRLTRKIRNDARDEEEERALLKARRRELEAYRRADALYIPRISHITGMINIHDIAWGDAGLWVVNSTFSCLCTLSAEHSFVPRWKPPFITEMAPEDRCHLNGMAMKDGRPRFVTTFSKADSRDAWREQTGYDGTLIDVDTGEILLDGLVMPHSPRYRDGYVYLCESGAGRLLRYRPSDGAVEVVARFSGFPRGIAFYGPLMFVGVSKVRQSDVRNPVPIAQEAEETVSGVWIFDTERFEEIAHVSFQGDVDQIYDIAVLENTNWPELMGFDHPRTRHLFDFPVMPGGLD